MKAEHIGYMVDEPIQAAEWYVENLGFTVIRKRGEPAHARFIIDEGKGTVLEIYNNPVETVPDYSSMNPLSLHLAFETDDVEAERDRLLAAGATLEADIEVTDEGDTLVMLRDPWGFPIQLAKRAEKLF
jgi:uncharacterized glyoxalase superfamily protein PhnB